MSWKLTNDLVESIKPELTALSGKPEIIRLFKTSRETEQDVVRGSYFKLTFCQPIHSRSPTGDGSHVNLRVDVLCKVLWIDISLGKNLPYAS